MAHRASFRIEFEADNPISGSLLRSVIEKNLSFVGIRVLDAYEIDPMDMNTEPAHVIRDLRNVPPSDNNQPSPNTIAPE